MDLAQANWHRGASTTQQQDELLPGSEQDQLVNAIAGQECCTTMEMLSISARAKSFSTATLSRRRGASVTQQDELRGRRILVVEDEYFIAVDIKEKLEAAGAVVVGPVATIGKALSLLETETPDGAILDLNLGGEMAFRLADAFKERAIPFVLATGYGRTDIPPRFADMAAFEKPINATEIAAALFKK